MYRVAGLRPVDPEFDKRRDKQQYELRVKRLDVDFDKRVKQYFEARTGIEFDKPRPWKGTPADRDRIEYWAAGVEAYFDAAGTGIAPNGADRPITTREALKAYDPHLYALVDETMAYKERVDWREEAVTGTNYCSFGLVFVPTRRRAGPRFPAVFPGISAQSGGEESRIAAYFFLV